MRPSLHWSSLALLWMLPYRVLNLGMVSFYCVTLPLARGVAVLAMRGERRVPLRVLGETFAGVFLEAPRRRRLFPSFLGVLRMLKAIDWRRSTCGDQFVNWLLWGSASKVSFGRLAGRPACLPSLPPPPSFSPSLT